MPKLFKLGKKPAKRDKRNLQLSQIRRAVIAPPPVYSVWDSPDVVPKMFANDVYGCCVITGRANQTLVFEYAETGKPTAITDKQVITEYMTETGGVDSGLVILDSLKLWRKKGWRAGAQRLYSKLFLEVNRQSIAEVKAAIYANKGIQIGLSLPLSAQKQIGKVWDVVKGPGSAAGSWGGHCVFVGGYNATGPMVATWGQLQQMTWAFWLKYCDEAYLVTDAPDSKRLSKLLLKTKLRAALEGLK